MSGIKRLASLLYDKLKGHKIQRFLAGATVKEDLKILYPMQDIEKRQRAFVVDKLALGMVILLIGVVLSAVLWVEESTDTIVKNNQLQRKAYGEGTSSIALVADNGSETAQLLLELEEKTFSQEELEKYYNSFLTELEVVVLGENPSFEEVSYDLVLTDCLDGYPFVVSWQTDEEYIDAKGKLVWNELTQPVIVELTARITCQEFERQEIFLCCVRSRASPASMQEQLQRQLQILEEENREREVLELPTEYGGKDIQWTRQTKKNGLFFFLVTPLICVTLLYSKDKDLHKRVEEREEQMKMDYPELVSKLALLLGAGMTVPNAWQRVVMDYTKKKVPESKRHYVYEEMLLTVNEWKNGVFQGEALEGFGRRCRLPRYNKLATMLAQNLRNGSTNLAVWLQEEAYDAFEERKHMARRQGEKAGTKLLFPMMLLLILVMVIIIVPTFLANIG